MTKLTHHDADEAASLRDVLTDQLRTDNVICSDAVEAAIRATPRHVFLPGVDLQQAYANTPVYTKTGPDGVSISAASQPSIVAIMLEQLDAQPGQRVLEVGAGTGYNAALIAAIVGPSGHVTTVDVDADLVNAARDHLAAAGVDNAEVVLGDGALGHPGAAPYDRVIATVGAWETPSPWLRQLAPGGRLVVPLRLRGAAMRSIAFERDACGWVSRDSQLCGFMPLRGIADDARHILTLTEGVTLHVHKDHTTDPALTGVLDRERREVWTQVLFPPMVSHEWMDLWLACTLDNPIMRMNTHGATAVDSGEITPMFPWGSMATTHAADLAYLTIRPAPPAADGDKLYEIGVIAHGPTAEPLAHELATQIQIWDKQRRASTVRFEIPDTPATADPAAARFVLNRPHHPVTVAWE